MAATNEQSEAQGRGPELDGHGATNGNFVMPSEAHLRFEIAKQFKRGCSPRLQVITTDELFQFVDGILRALDRSHERAYGKDLPNAADQAALEAALHDR